MPLRSVSYGGGIGGLAPATPYGGGTAFGEKYPVPDPLEIARRTAQGNLANLPDYEAYANKIDAANYIKMMDQIRKGNPNYDQQVLQNAGMISDELGGKIPQDVVDQLTQRGAERGITIGSPGSPNTNAALMKAFYTTSTGQQEAGAKNYLNFQASIPRAPITDPSKYGADPNSVYTAQLLANTVRAAPDPQQKYFQELAAAQSGVNAGRGAYGGGGFTPGAYTPPTLTPYRPAPPPGPTSITGTGTPTPSAYGSGSTVPPERYNPQGNWSPTDEEDMNALMYGDDNQYWDIGNESNTQQTPYQFGQPNFTGSYGQDWDPFADAIGG